MLHHDKSRWDKAVSEFQISINEPSDGELRVSYLGKTERKPKAEQAQDLILELLGNAEKMTRREILNNRGEIGENSIGVALGELKQKGAILSEGGTNTPEVFYLAHRDEDDEL